MGKGIGGIIAGVALTFAGGFFGAAWLVAAGRAMFWSAVIGTASRAISKKPSTGGATMAAQGRMETVRSPLSPWQVVYGRCRVGGTLTYFETTTDNQTALMIVTLAGHPVAAIRDVYYNDLSTLDYAASGAAGSATGKFAGYSTVYRSDGTEGAAQPFADLVARGLSWTSAHLQRDRAKVHTTHAFSNEVWQTGLPQVSAVINGVKDIYDPRLGSPTVNRWSNNPALCIAHYLTASYGLDADYASEIDEAALIAAANICDERVTLSGNNTGTIASVSDSNDWIQLAVDSPHVDFGDGVRFAPGSPGELPGGLTEGTTYYAVPMYEGDTTTGQIFRVATSYANAMAGTYASLSSAAGSGTTTMTLYDEPRYRLNGAFALTEKPQAVLERMLMAMAGKLVNSGGVWFIYAGAYTAPTLEFDEDDFAGPIELQTNQSRRDNANAIKGTFVDPSNRFQPVDFPPITSQTYFQEDGGERVWRDLDLTAFVTSGSQAQRLAKIDLITTRLGLTVRARFKLSAFRMLTGTTVSLTNTQLGWSSKAFEVANCVLVVEQDGRIEVDAILRETDSAVYDWSVSDEQLATIAPNTNLPDPSTVAPPTGLTFTQSTVLPDRGTLSLTAPSDSFVSSYQYEYQITGAASWNILPPTADTAINLEKLVAAKYSFRAKAINVFGSSSSYATTTGDLTSARATSNYTGAQDLLGITKSIFSADASTATGAPANSDVYALAYCPANNKIYGTVQDGDPFGMVLSPVSPAFSFVVNSSFEGLRCLAACYVPGVNRMYFSQVISGSPTPASIIGVDPLDDSIDVTGAVTGYEIDSLMYCPGDGYLWGTAESDGKVLVFDPDDGSLVATISTGGAPRYMAYCPTTNEVWVGDRSANAIFVISLTGSPTYNIVVATPGNWVRGIAYCASEDRIVAAVRNTGLVFINPATGAVAATAAIGNTGGFTLWCPTNDRIYCLDFTSSDIVYTVVPRTQAYYSASLAVSGRYTEACYCPLNNFLYVASNNTYIAVSST